MNKKVFFHDYLQIQDRIWFSGINVNGLFSYDIKARKINLEAIFARNREDELFMHMKMFEYKNKILFVPFQTRYIYIYDIGTQVMREYLLALDDSQIMYSYYMTGVQQGGKTYLLPCRSNLILEIDIETGKQKKIAMLTNEWGDSKLPYAHKAIDVYENKLVIAPFQKDFFELVDIITGKREKVFIDEKYNGITHLKVWKNKLLLVGKNGKIGVHKWTGECLQSVKLESKKGKHKYYDMTLINSKLYLTETDSNKIAVYNLEMNSIFEIELSVEEDKQFAAFWGTTLFLKQISENVVSLMSAYDGKIYFINTDNDEIVQGGSICLENTGYGECFANQTKYYISEEYLDKVGINARQYIIKEILR